MAVPAIALCVGCKPTNVLLWVTYVVQQIDLYIHLRFGSARESSAAHPTISAATECTLLRAYAASALIGGSVSPRRAFLFGAATDVVDGALARVSRGETAFGARLDGLYDGYFLLAAARTARRRKGLDRCAETLIWLRFLTVLLMAVVALLMVRPVTVGSTWPGKIASGLQAATLYEALGPVGTEPRRRQCLAMTLGTLLAVSGQAARLWPLKSRW
jgi:phosphatidylglycerophosphate synthase